MVSKVLVGGLQVERNRIVNSRPDTSVTQVLLKLFAVLNLDDIEVKTALDQEGSKGRLIPSEAPA